MFIDVQVQTLASKGSQVAITTMKRLLVLMISMHMLSVDGFAGYKRFSSWQPTTKTRLSHSPLPDEEVELPDWATLSPPSDADTIDELILGSDDFVSIDLENEESTPERISASVVYQDGSVAADESLFLVEPRLATIEPNGGTLEVTVTPIADEDKDGAFHIPKCWLVLTTEAGETWYYRLIQNAEAHS